METYLVGGAVRDALLGRAVQDRDWVVVGATVQQMLDAGYTQVGRDFPVFLHPQTQEEYALARTERKSAPGYHGFVVHAAPDVTLEQDLARRDLTINAIAAELDATAQRGGAALRLGAITDPFGGRADLQAKVLRHATDAFREDPVRLLRLARFAARFHDFSVAPDTMDLLRDMVASGEVDHLVPERVWQELSRGLQEEQPARMFAVLQDCGALARLLPELELTPARTAILDRAARQGLGLEARYALLDVEGSRALQQRLRVPVACTELANTLAGQSSTLRAGLGLDAASLVQCLVECDAFRKPARFAELLQATACEVGASAAQWPIALRWARALQLAQGVDSGSLAAQAQGRGADGAQVGVAIREARVAAVASGLTPA